MPGLPDGFLMTRSRQRGTLLETEGLGTDVLNRTGDSEEVRLVIIYFMELGTVDKVPLNMSFTRIT